VNWTHGVLITFVLVAQFSHVRSFSSPPTGLPTALLPKHGFSKQSGSAYRRSTDDGLTKVCGEKRSDRTDECATFVKRFIVGSAILAGSMSFSTAAFADELGRSVDAPMLFTGEETQICVKRGPLGACRKTEKRTKENDNDKATKYFNDPELKFQEKYRAAQLQAIEDERNGVPAAGSADFDGNALVARLKQQTEDNRAKNDAAVRKQTLQNNLGASFGPFSSTVPILNADGVDYKLLDNKVAMRLKKAGYIDNNKKFITQPPQKVIDDAIADSQLTFTDRLGSLIDGALGKEKIVEEELVEEVPPPPPSSPPQEVVVESTSSDVVSDTPSAPVTSSDAAVESTSVAAVDTTLPTTSDAAVDTTPPLPTSD